MVAISGSNKQLWLLEQPLGSSYNQQVGLIVGEERREEEEWTDLTSLLV